MAAPVTPPTAAQVGQSVFCKPAQPVNTPVSRTKGRAVRMMLICFLLRGSAGADGWSKDRSFHLRHCAAPPYLLEIALYAGLLHAARSRPARSAALVSRVLM